MTSIAGGGSLQSHEVLRELKQHHNVLISGVPASGKTRLLSEVAELFQGDKFSTSFAPEGSVLFPVSHGDVEPADWPSPERKDRRVWYETFHQGTKFRDFVFGLRPKVESGVSFEVSIGPMVQAIRHALTADGASLLIIDEINRGPAVLAFGSLIGAIESSKRLAEDGAVLPESIPFSVMDETGVTKTLYMPAHLYLVAAMNEADTSIEPLDVAFRRRFIPYVLLPDEALLRNWYGLPAVPVSLPDEASTSVDVYEAAVQAWTAINRGIELARGREFQLGHGALMGAVRPTLSEASLLAVHLWGRLLAHTREVFFGDVRGLTEAIGAGRPGSPYKPEDSLFAGTPVTRLVEPKVDFENVYRVLKAAATVQNPLEPAP